MGWHGITPGTANIALTGTKSDSTNLYCVTVDLGDKYPRRFAATNPNGPYYPEPGEPGQLALHGPNYFAQDGGWEYQLGDLSVVFTGGAFGGNTQVAQQLAGTWQGQRVDLDCTWSGSTYGYLSGNLGNRSLRATFGGVGATYYRKNAGTGQWDDAGMTTSAGVGNTYLQGPAGCTTYFGYSPSLGQLGLTSVTDPEGRTWYFEYEAGYPPSYRLTAAVNPDGSRQESSVSPGYGAATYFAYTDPNGDTTYYHYQSPGKVDQVIDPGGR